MGDIIKLIETANKYIGCKEGDKKYTQLIQAFEQTGNKYDGQGCCEVACAFFVLTFGEKKARKLIPITNYARGQSKLWPDGLQKKPIPGCLVYFGSSEVDHVELVTEITGNRLTTIDGNSYHSVVKRYRYIDDANIKGYGIPAYTEDKNELLNSWTDAAISVTSLKKGMTGKLVLWLQEYLYSNGYYTGYLDGVFGSKTDLAVREYQKANKLPVVDGIAGPYFFTKVLK